MRREEKVYTPSEAARRLGVSVDAIRKWEREGLLSAVKSERGRRFFTEEVLKKFLHNRGRAEGRRAPTLPHSS